jgi:hypothetical protein
MNGTRTLVDCIEMDLDDLTVYINVYDNSLSRKWLAALNQLLVDNLLLEKNYCFLGFPEGPRDGALICSLINQSIAAINRSDVGYRIDNHYTWATSVDQGGGVNHEQFNLLHSYFEHLQGTAHRPSPYYAQADSRTRWHIRQLNLLCHEFESWQLSYRKLRTAPEWRRPSQLMCWLGAPRFALEDEDLELFGVETINRSLGGVYVGVNKAVGKHHWEVFLDEGSASRIGELTTTTLAPQTLAAGDFDIEWARDPGAQEWQIKRLAEFREWLTANGFDPDDRSLTIGHPKIGQVDLQRSFGSEDYRVIWAALNTRLNVRAIRTSAAAQVYPYTWADADYMENQIKCLG